MEDFVNSGAGVGNMVKSSSFTCGFIIRSSRGWNERNTLFGKAGHPRLAYETPRVVVLVSSFALCWREERILHKRISRRSPTPLREASGWLKVD
jgi:hypothetical protein